MQTNKKQWEDALSPEREARRRQRHEARAGQTYRQFLKLASEKLSVPPDRASQICVAVLAALEQRLPWDEMSDLVSQLPFKLRELLATCDEPRERMRARDIGQAELLAMVARELDASPDEAENYVRFVFQLLAETVSPDEVSQVIHVLPASLRALWPAVLSS